MRSMWKLAAIIGTLALAAGCTATDDGPFVDTNGTDPNPEMSVPKLAQWILDPSVRPTPESTSLHLIASKQPCRTPRRRSP